MTSDIISSSETPARAAKRLRDLLGSEALGDQDVVEDDLRTGGEHLSHLLVGHAGREFVRARAQRALGELRLDLEHERVLDDPVAREHLGDLLCAGALRNTDFDMLACRGRDAPSCVTSHQPPASSTTMTPAATIATIASCCGPASSWPAGSRSSGSSAIHPSLLARTLAGIEVALQEQRRSHHVDGAALSSGVASRFRHRPRGLHRGETLVGEVDRYSQESRHPLRCGANPSRLRPLGSVKRERQADKHAADLVFFDQPDEISPVAEHALRVEHGERRGDGSRGIGDRDADALLADVEGHHSHGVGGHLREAEALARSSEGRVDTGSVLSPALCHVRLASATTREKRRYRTHDRVGIEPGRHRGIGAGGKEDRLARLHVGRDQDGRVDAARAQDVPQASQRLAGARRARA